MSEVKVKAHAGPSAIAVKQWKAREGDVVSPGTVLFTYSAAPAGSSGGPELRYKCDMYGTLRRRLAAAGAVVQPGGELLHLEPCQHPTVMKDLCAECGADLLNEDQPGSASVAMLHSIPELRVSKEQANAIGRRDTELLLKHRKLVLLVDLDQTLIHTTNDNIPPNLRDVCHFQLYGPNSPWYHTRLRPGTQSFLQSIANYYQLHICTFGARLYAHTIAKFLDPDGEFFSHRILSRDECFSQQSKTANLKALFPCGEHMVCIIDDREDVWSYAPNLIHVKPYHFFKHTGDINAPPGLEKVENDDKEGFDFSKMQQMTAESESQTTAEAEAEKKPEPTESAAQTDLARRDSMPNLTDDEDSDARPGPPDIIEELNADLSLSEDENEDEDGVKPKKSSRRTAKEKAKSSAGRTSDALKQQGASGEAGSNRPSQETAGTEAQSSSDNRSADAQTSSDTSQNSDGAESPEKSDGKVDTADSKGSVADDARRPGPDRTEVAGLKNGSVDTGEMEVRDDDDYLLHLEDILVRIHRAFYSMLESCAPEDPPDLRLLIPYVRRKVLKGVRLVFSGVVPNNVEVSSSRAYRIAASLGAVVQERLVRKGPREELTTHLLAARLGTAKVNEALRSKRIRLVTPDWLWCCAERWEHADERLFPLTAETAVNRPPPAHCSSPDLEGERSRRQSFQDTLNPLLAFSPDDIARMDEEVEDILQSGSDSEDEDEDEGRRPPAPAAVARPPDADSSGDEDEDDEDTGRGRARKRRSAECEDSSEDEESPSVKFRRGEPLPSDTEMGDDGNEDEDEDNRAADLDEDWSMMGAELERELGDEE